MLFLIIFKTYHHRLNIVRGYTLDDFREELKKLLKLCGISNKKFVLFITDADICVCEDLLEDINCLLNTGSEDQDLFDQEEIDSIVMQIKQDAQENQVRKNN